MASSVVKTPKTPKRYITFKVVTEITLSETDIQELCQDERPLTKEQLKWIFDSMEGEAKDTDEGVVLEVDGEKRKEPGELVRERILDEIENLDAYVKCFECGKQVDERVEEDGLWDRCSGGDTYKCERCSNPPEEAEEEADDGESSD